MTLPDIAPRDGTDISGQHLAAAHQAYAKWFGQEYDLGALDAVLCTAAANSLAGDPPWLLVVGGSGIAKTETIVPLARAGALIASTISGEAALLSGTAKKERAADATGGLLYELGDRGLLVVKDFTSILSMNRDTRALVLAALREIHDGHWSRRIGGEGGRNIPWHGRLVIIGACTTAWDAAHQVVSTMGDRFLLVRPRPGHDGRRKAGLQAMQNVRNETAMREELGDVAGKLINTIPAATGRIALTDDEQVQVLDVADIITRARTAVERDFQGNPAFAHALEMPTRLAKQLVQVARGGLAIGMTRSQAMGVADRVAADTMPPLRLRVLDDVAGHPGTPTADAVKRLQLPRKTVDRTLQELHLLELLTMDTIEYGSSTRWVYSLAEDVDKAALERLARNVSTHPRDGQ
ncbi:MAG: ArsR family transcriptional regulator [Actinobacteria bacterium]|nr:ArsR family transcriptional regulator [Actinomycetota bacterium]